MSKKNSAAAKAAGPVRTTVNVAFQLRVRSGRPVSDSAIRRALAAADLGGLVLRGVNDADAKNAGLVMECVVGKLQAGRAPAPAKKTAAVG